MTLGTFTVMGLGRLRTIKGMIKSIKHENLTRPQMLPNLNHFYTQEDTVFQQEIPRATIQKKCRSFFR